MLIVAFISSPLLDALLLKNRFGERAFPEAQRKGKGRAWITIRKHNQL